MPLLMKIIGIAFIVFSTTAVGVNLSVGLKNRVKTLRWFIGATDEIGEKIRYTSAELGYIVGSIYGVEKYLEIKAPFSVTLKKNEMDEQDKKIINEFFSQLGMGDSESQIKRCQNYKRQLMRQSEDADKQLREKSKLYKMLGFFGGLTIAIVLL